MKNLRLPFFFAFLAAFSLACSSKSTEEKAEINEAEQLKISSEKTIETANIPVKFAEESTTTIFNSYFELKDALVQTDGEKASIEAKKLADLLIEEKFNSIKKDVQRIAESTDPTIQREAFDELSEQMIVLAKNSELASGNLFLQHCPMANGNKGANWISLSEEIRNPYFGDRMLKCGSVTEKI